MKDAPRCWHSRGDDQTYQRNEGDPMEITLQPTRLAARATIALRGLVTS